MISAAIRGAQVAMLVMGLYLLIAGKTSHNNEATVREGLPHESDTGSGVR
jgi:hypothetical protein